MSAILRFVIIFIFLGIAYAGDGDAQLTSYSNVLNEDGTYSYQYESSNGITVQESGTGGVYAQGYARHYSPEGELFELTYTADENGFHPSGRHIPTAHPVPEYIMRAIEYIRSHPSPESQGF